MTVTNLHPPITPARIRYDQNVDGNALINVGGLVQLVKGGDTPQCKALYRLYVAEYRSLEGQPIAHQEREERAMRTALERFGFTIVDATPPASTQL